MNAMTTATSSHRRTVRDAGRSGAHLELTRRGRVVLTVLIFLAGLVTAVAVLFAFDIPSALADGGEDTVTVTVQPGDTLWGYAEHYAPASVDPRDYVIEVQRMNDLPSARVPAGVQIELPVDGSAAR